MPAVSAEEEAAVKASMPGSPEAARLYAEGLAKLRLYDEAAARDLLEKAVAAEPDHALAHSALAAAWSGLGYDVKALEEARKAHELSADLSRETRLQVERTSFGFDYAAIRRPIANANVHDCVRVTVYVAPFTALIPPNNEYNVATLLAPIDDHNTVFHFIAWSDKDTAWGNKAGIDQEVWRKFNVAQPGIDLDRGFNNLRTRANDYQQDRNAMRLGNFTGIKGIPNQDIAMWETMGPIADRTKERLGASDLAVVEFRKLMVDAARQMRDAGVAIGRTTPHIPHASIRSSENIVAKSTNWRTFTVVDAEESKVA